MPSFPATNKRKDPRFKWFKQHYGDQCWEIDALDPNVLRDCVRAEIRKFIEWDEWHRCEAVNSAERESLKEVMTNWAAACEG